jgi:hypothetical protein
MRGLTLRLLAEITPHSRAGRADGLAERLWRDMAIALIDWNQISVHDHIGRLVLFGSR